MSLFAWLALCGLLLNVDNRADDGSADGGNRQSVSTSVGAPRLTISATQRDAVRAAAAAYRGTAVTIIVLRSTSSYRAFAEGLATALRSAGLAVAIRLEETPAAPDCPDTPGLRVVYGAIRSGAVNAIAEALIRSRVLSDSLTGCRVANEDELTFIVSSGTS